MKEQPKESKLVSMCCHTGFTKMVEFKPIFRAKKDKRENEQWVVRQWCSQCGNDCGVELWIAPKSK